MQHLFKEILKSIGEDPTREGLVRTPERAADALSYLTQGYKQNFNEIINGAIFESTMNEMVIVKNIEMYSMCEHHLLPFHGQCHVGYLPNGKIIGLSKIARIVDYYARRLQVQERLSLEIAECIESITGARGVGVVIEAKHLCMMMRGVTKQNSTMATSVMLGEMRNNPSSRMEFIQLIHS
ncbi:MAG: GTP cyclohydrolase I FolE [Legionellales bacterium RIFCSPHIGHO2_12_FULL_37_14]|nr:MAG: GTP cyclohydrolase I FolE [Legionellales bacterium RIFCSPHIGHO2_12_FULL_37_14]